MAGKSGTTNDFHDAWMMAYAPNIVVGAWVGHTGPGNQNMNNVFGTMVGSSVLKDFINNGLTQANFPVQNFQQPDGLVSGPPCSSNSNINPSASASASPSASPKAGAGSEKELYLPGTECTAPSATATPSPSPSPSPSSSLLPSIVPSGLTPSPVPSTSATPSASSTPAASQAAAAAATPAPS